MFRSTLADAGYSTDAASTNWYQIADIGSTQSKSIAIGQDSLGNKIWVTHTAATGAEVMMATDGQEVASPVTGNTNGGSVVWESENLSNNHITANGGPSIAWGNNNWLGVGDDVPSDDYVLFGSANGGSTWTSVQTSAQDQNDAGRCINYKGSGDIWFFTVQDTIYWNDGDSVWSNGNWDKRLEVNTSDGSDIMAMAYDPASTRWGCITANGKFYTSTDDWSTLESGVANTPTATLSSFDAKGLCFVGGDINKWVAVGSGGKIFLSSNANGSSWGEISHGLGSPTNIYQVATDNTTIVAVGTGTTIWASQDGTTWKDVVAGGVNGSGGTNFGTACWSIASDIIGAGLR